MPGPTYLVGFDGSAASQKALEWAVRRARAEDAAVAIATAVPESVKDSFFTTMLLPGLDLSKIVPEGSFEKNARRRLEEAAKATGLGERATVHVLHGEAWHALVEAARAMGPEAIVVGERSYEKVGQGQLGAVAERVLRHAPCTVVVVR